MTLQMTITFGDLVVTAGTVTTIIVAYLSIKSSLSVLKKHEERLDEHDEVLQEHGEGIARLDSAVFDRRRSDRPPRDNQRR